MNIKLPGSLRVKKIILIILVIISVCVLSYEFIQNKNNKKDNSNSKQEEFIGDNDSGEESKENSEVFNNNASEETSKESKENVYSEKEETLYNEAYNLFFSNKYEEAIKINPLIIEDVKTEKDFDPVRGSQKFENLIKELVMKRHCWRDEDMFNVLVVDDEKEIRDAIEIYLRGEHLNVFKAEDGIEALEILEEQKIHLIILDVMMPRLDGIRTCLKIRENQNLPIIMLSAKGEDSDKILGLNVGADDYITKPFNHLELVARVKSQLRRYEKPLNVEAGKDIIKVKDLVIDTVAKKITVRGEEVKVTATEYKILHLLASNLGKVFSIKEIYEKVWEENFYKSENTVTVHIRRIREKIEINTKEPEYIKVVWGIGYKIEKDS